MFKLAVFDIDGTLLNSKSELETENLEALIELKKSGIKIILATGKHYISATNLYELFDLEEPQVSCNGAIIYCPKSKEVIKTNPIDQDTFLNVIGELNKTDIPTVVYTSKGFYSTYPPSKVMEIITVGENKIYYIDDYSSITDVVKILCLLPEANKEQDTYLRSLATDTISVVRTGKSFLEFVAPASNKAIAIGYIADMYNIRPEEIIAFGDSENDVEMLKMAGLGVCMENGSKVAKESSDVIVSNNDSHGVKEGIYKFVLKK